MPKNEALNLSSFTQAEIQALFKKARMKVRTSEIRILTAPAQGESGRVLIVTPRKSGTAPVRNRFRRRVRAIFREGRIFEKKVDFIIIANKKTCCLSFKKIHECILKALSFSLS